MSDFRSLQTRSLRPGFSLGYSPVLPQEPLLGLLSRPKESRYPDPAYSQFDSDIPDDLRSEAVCLRCGIDGRYCPPTHRGSGHRTSRDKLIIHLFAPDTRNDRNEAFLI